MAQLEYFYKKLIDRKELVDNFTVLHPAATVMSKDATDKIEAYKHAFQDYYKFKPTVKMIFASESSHKKLEELRQGVMAKCKEANDALDHVGFDIVAYLAGLENSFQTVENKECICVTQALGEACCKYLSTETQRNWIHILKQVILTEDEIGNESQPLYMFTKNKIVLVPNEELEQGEDFEAVNNNNM